MREKKCIRCGKIKSEYEFYKRSEGSTRFSYCKDCCREYKQARRKKRREARVELGAIKLYTKDSKELVREWFALWKIGKCCERCGENHPACLDFHHRDPEEKEASVSQMVKGGWSKESILKELAKCDILCSNCHRKKHWRKNTVHTVLKELLDLAKYDL